MNLEAELAQARDLITKQAKIVPPGNNGTNEQITAPSESAKVNLIEYKTNALEIQYACLAAKVDQMQMNFMANSNTQPPQKSRKVYACEECDCEYDEKSQLNKHQLDSHRSSELPQTEKPREIHVCEECGCEYHEKCELMKHQLNSHRRTAYSCKVCDFDSRTC